MAAEIQTPTDAQPAVSDSDKVIARINQHGAAKATDGRFVRYLGPRTGTSTRRRTTVAHWNSLGIPATQPHEWSLANDHKLPESAFTDQQLDHMFTKTDMFELVDGAGNPIPR